MCGEEWIKLKMPSPQGHLPIFFLAHRLVCLAFHGFPLSKQASHACHHGCNPGGHKGCVQPYHVEWHTQEDNLKQYKTVLERPYANIPTKRAGTNKNTIPPLCLLLLFLSFEVIVDDSWWSHTRVYIHIWILPTHGHPQYGASSLCQEMPPNNITERPGKRRLGPPSILKGLSFPPI